MCANSDFTLSTGHEVELYLGYYGGKLVINRLKDDEVEYDLQHDPAEPQEVQRDKMEVFLMGLDRTQLVEMVLKIVENGVEG